MCHANDDPTAVTRSGLDGIPDWGGQSNLGISTTGLCADAPMAFNQDG